MKKNIQILLILAIAVAYMPINACVSSKKHKAVVAAHEQTIIELNKTITERDGLIKEVKGLRTDTTAYGDLYRKLQNEKRQLLATSSADIKKLAMELNAKETLLNEKEKALADRESKLKELQEMMAKKDAAVNELRNKVANALRSFKSDELTVNMRDGKVYVSLSENLLFASGSTTVDIKGVEAIKKLADVLSKNPDLDITIEGHTDNVPIVGNKFKDNWDLSALRATSIVRILRENGVNPKQMDACGKGEYYPIASNDTPQGRSKNRRTEIVISPKLDELFNILGKTE